VNARSNETRARILQVAAEHFARHGYDGATVRKIVRAAGVTQPTLYYHYQDKEGLCRAVLEEGLERFREAVAQATDAAGGLVDRIVRTITARCDFARQNPDLTRFFYGMLLELGGRPAGLNVASMRNRMIGIVRDFVDDLAHSGPLDKSEVHDVTNIILALINFNVLSILDGLEPPPTEPRLRRSVELLCRGIGQPSPNTCSDG